MLALNARPNAFIVESLISPVPWLSNFEIVTLLIPDLFASSSCVRPLFSLIFLKLFFNISLLSIFLLTIVNYVFSINP